MTHIFPGLILKVLRQKYFLGNMKLSFALLLGAVFAKRNVPGLLKPLDSTAQTEAAGSVREKAR